MNLKNEKIMLSFAEKSCLWFFPISCIVGWISPNSKYYILTNMEVYLYLFTVLFSFIVGRRFREQRNKAIVNFLILSSFFFFLIATAAHLERPFITMVYSVLFAASFLLLKHEYRKWCYERYVNIMSVLFLLGMIEYALAYIGINFFWGTYERGPSSFYQGVFMSINTYYTSIPARFMSICEEPGSVGSLAFFGIATIDRNKNKKQFYIFLVAGLLSLSLAFYLLGTLFFLLNFKMKDLSFGKLALAGISLVVLVALFGDFINYRITGRLSDAENFQALDNRNSEEVDAKFSNYVGTSDAIFGLGHRTFYDWKKKTENVSVGFKEVIFMYGFFGVFLMITIFSVVYIKFHGANKKSYKILLLYWISFYQRSYWFEPAITMMMFCSRRKEEIKELRNG